MSKDSENLKVNNCKPKYYNYENYRTMNWNETKIRCSCLGKIMTPGKGTVLTEKQSEELERLAGLPRTEKQEATYQRLLEKKNAPPELSDTAKSYLREVYLLNKYGKETAGGSERSKYTIKGVSVEGDSIKLLMRLDGQRYLKNEDFFQNDFIMGTPDIVVRDEAGNATKIIDIKSSWDGASLLANLGQPLNSNYFYQVQGYMALTGATEAEIAYCLVSMPDEIINSEKKRIYYLMNPATEDNADYKKAIERLENNMTFGDIPETERIIKFKVPRDEQIIQNIYEKVQQCRLWLAEFEKMHTTINKIWFICTL